MLCLQYNEYSPVETGREARCLSPGMPYFYSRDREAFLDALHALAGLASTGEGIRREYYALFIPSVLKLPTERWAEAVFGLDPDEEIWKEMSLWLPSLVERVDRRMGIITEDPREIALWLYERLAGGWLEYSAPSHPLITQG